MQNFTTKTGDDELPTIEADRLDRMADEFAEKMMEGADTERQNPEALKGFSNQFKRNYYKFMTSRYVVVPSKNEPQP